MLSLNFFVFSPSPGFRKINKCSHRVFSLGPRCAGGPLAKKKFVKRNSGHIDICFLSPCSLGQAILSLNLFNFSFSAGFRNTKRCSCMIIKKLLSIDFLTQNWVDLHCHWCFAVAELCYSWFYPSATHNQILNYDCNRPHIRLYYVLP